MATTTYGTEYVQSSDLVSNWPGSSLNVANRIDNVSLVGNGVNNQTGTSYTLVLADGGKLVTFDNAAAIALTVPTNASVAFPTGVRIKFTNKGAGLVTVAGAGGVTLNGNQLTIAQNRSAMLYKLDTNTWVMTSDQSDPGLAFVTVSTFSASSAVNVNNCFTSTYDNYQILLDVPTVSANCNIQIRLRASGTDSTTTYYLGASQVRMTDGNNGSDFLNNGTAWNISGPETGLLVGGASIIINGPALAQITRLSYQSIAVATAVAYARSGVAYHNTASAYDGFSVIPSAGNITGSVRVYGFRKS